MSEEQLNEVVSMACGWKFEMVGVYKWWTHPVTKFCPERPLDYGNDLRAMHEAEKSIPESLRNEYVHWVETITKAPDSEFYPYWYVLITATANHRREAFLRALGLWKEPPQTPQPDRGSEGV